MEFATGLKKFDININNDVNYICTAILYNIDMLIETTYSNARSNLASLLDQVTDDNEIVVINRRGRERVAMVSESELSSLLETAHLLRSPKNADRLDNAIKDLAKGKGERVTVDVLREEFGVKQRAKK